MNITVTHTLHPDVLSLFRNLFTGFPSGIQTNGSTKEAGKKISEQAPKPEPVAQATTPAPEVKAVTLEAVRAAVKKQADSGKKESVKALLSEFGADRVTSLTPEQYADFLTKVEAL